MFNANDMIMRLMQKHLDRALRDHSRIVRIYKEKYSQEQKRDWRTYEQRLALRMKAAAQELESAAGEAFSMIEVSKPARGRPQTVPVTKKVMILLLKDIFQLSNRRMANMLSLFTVLTGIGLSYKSIERVYSDELARLTIHNMYVILAKRKGIRDPDASGDGTGYSLTIGRHYRTEREKELKKGKKGVDGKRKGSGKAKAFAYAFALMDLGSGMYIGYGTSMKSEKEAFRKALVMAGETAGPVRSVRLDKYYSCQSIVGEFGPGTVIYIILKKNATIRGPLGWKAIARSFAGDPFMHLREYYRRNHSESGFSADKRMGGWKVWQKREERIDTALLSKGVWHNLMLIG